ncbi:MAG TPA: transglycosylase domain-containing protein, partial [Polyangiaceae bacterium]
MKRERVLKLLKIAGAVALACLLSGVLAVVLTIRHYEGKLPTLDKVRRGYEPPQVTRVLSRDGTVLASLFTERRTVVKFSEIPNHVKLAFLAAEDAAFYQHQGLD